jgi:hypothetical protein
MSKQHKKKTLQFLWCDIRLGIISSQADVLKYPDTLLALYWFIRGKKTVPSDSGTGYLQ